MKLAHAVWYCCLNNNFYCLNITTCIFTTLFHLHVFPQHLNNVTRNLLPNGPKSILHQEREREREREKERERERERGTCTLLHGLVDLCLHQQTKAFFCPLRVLVDLRFGSDDVVEGGSLRQNRMCGK